MSSDLFLAVPDDFVWLKPWESVNDSGDVFVSELRRELAEGHILFSVTVAAVARRTDCDDVLFATADPSKPLAAVHLTWSGRAEPDPPWPHTMLYQSWQDWITRRQMPDHKRWMEEG